MLCQTVFCELTVEFNKTGMNHLIIEHLNVIRINVRLQTVHYRQVPGSMWASFIYLFTVCLTTLPIAHII